MKFPSTSEMMALIRLARPSRYCTAITLALGLTFALQPLACLMAAARPRSRSTMLVIVISKRNIYEYIYLSFRHAIGTIRSLREYREQEKGEKGQDLYL